MAMYESDHTKFIRDWLAQHPEELEVQKTGRALWWDKPALTPDEQKRRKESAVPQTGYYYHTD